jgi:serine/threonine protein kinase
MIASMSYRAPELLKHDGGAIFVFAADVWSLGAIFYRLLERTHKPLVCDEEKTTDGALQQILNLQACNLTASMLKHYALPERLEKNQARWDQIVQDTSVNAADLLDSLLNLRPELRITMKTALRHPYLCQHIVL